MKKMKSQFLIVCVVIIIILSVIYFSLNKNSEVYSFKNAKMNYNGESVKVRYNINSINENLFFSEYKIEYESRNFLQHNTTIHGLLFIPKIDGREVSNSKAIVLLPGGGQTKESASKLAMEMVSLGYSVFVIDQRGIGETGGYYLSLDEDYKAFSEGNEPIQHLSVYDALAASYVLRGIGKFDKNNIALVGISMGGRYAIIATALDKRIKGAIIISSSGYDFKSDTSKPYNDYLLSIDPDRYVGDIAPRKLFMFQSKNDSIVKIENAKNTFDKAGEPKMFYTVDNCTHGYCEAMHDNLSVALKGLFSN